MDTTTLDFNTLTLLVTLLVAILGSTLTIVTVMHRQFNHLDTKIGGLDTRVRGLETKVTALDTKIDGLDGLDGLESRFDKLESRFDGLDGRFDGLESRFDRLDGKVDRMGSDFSDARERLARIEGHLMAPEGFRMQGSHPPAAPENPSPDQEANH